MLQAFNQWSVMPKVETSMIFVISEKKSDKKSSKSKLLLFKRKILKSVFDAIWTDESFIQSIEPWLTLISCCICSFSSEFWEAMFYFVVVFMWLGTIKLNMKLIHFFLWPSQKPGKFEHSHFL